MDILPDQNPEDIQLPYDEPTPGPSNGKSTTSLLSRIGQSRVYALSDSPTASILSRSKKRKGGLLDRLDGTTSEVPDDANGDIVPADSFIRANAITLSGTPIADLDTAKIFAYASHFTEIPPTALEWIDDSKVVMIYPSVASAHAAFQAIMHDDTMTPEDAPEHLSRPVPSDLWSPQMRVASVLEGKQGLSGDITMRWANKNDVKKKGAAAQSSFYRTYGEQAGREGRLPVGQNKRRRGEDGTVVDDDERRAKLDRMLESGFAEPDDLKGLPPYDSRGRRGGGRRDDRIGAERKGVNKDDLDAELEDFVNSRPSES